MSLKTKKEQEESVIYFALKCRELKSKIKELQDTEGRFKEELRGLMKEYEIKHLKNEVVDVEIRYPTPEVNPGLLRINFSEIAKEFVEEKVTVFISAENRKKLKEQFPDAYNECVCEQSTPRLYIK